MFKFIFIEVSLGTKDYPCPIAASGHAILTFGIACLYIKTVVSIIFIFMLGLMVHIKYIQSADSVKIVDSLSEPLDYYLTIQ